MTALGQGLVVAVLGADGPEPLQVLHGPAQQPGVLDAVAVVGEEPDPGVARCHLTDGGEVPALEPPGQRPRRDHLGEPEEAARGRHLLGNGGVVADRVGVGHGADGRVAAEHRRRRAGGDGLLVLPARLPEVDVGVDEARRHDGPVDVDDLGPAGVEPGPDRLDAAAGDQDVAGGVGLAGRVDEAAPAQQEVSQEGPPPPPGRRHRA